jgi:hypothetical protein
MDRRRKMAEAMQQQAIAPIDMPTMPGVRVSPMQGFAKLLQSYIAGKNLRRADEEQKDYENQVSQDTAKFMRNIGQYETVPGNITSPAQEARYEPPVPIQENLDRKQELVNLIAPAPENAARAAIGYNLMRPEDRERITNLPSMTEGKEIPAVPAERGPSRQIPVLNAGLLSPTDPLAFKTPQIRNMLAQYLMQQEVQKQAAALRKQEAEQAIVKFGPEDTAGRIVDGKFVPIVTGKPKIEYTKVETRDPVTGQPIIKYVDKTQLGALGNILAPYTGMVADLMQAQDLPAAIKSNPDALRLIGGFLGKQGGDVTAADFAKVMISLDETNARLRNEGIPPVSTNIVKPKNIMIQSKQLPPQGTPLENGQVYDTPRGQARWNGTKFVTID